MGSDKVGVATTHNAPSKLTDAEKRLRAKARSLKRELEFQSKRVSRFESEAANDSNPANRASAKVELELAKQRVSDCEVDLAMLETGSVN